MLLCLLLMVMMQPLPELALCSYTFFLFSFCNLLFGCLVCFRLFNSTFRTMFLFQVKNNVFFAQCLWIFNNNVETMLVTCCFGAYNYISNSALTCLLSCLARYFVTTCDLCLLRSFSHHPLFIYLFSRQ